MTLLYMNGIGHYDEAILQAQSEIVNNSFKQTLDPLFNLGFGLAAKSGAGRRGQYGYDGVTHGARDFPKTMGIGTTAIFGFAHRLEGSDNQNLLTVMSANVVSGSGLVLQYSGEIGRYYITRRSGGVTKVYSSEDGSMGTTDQYHFLELKLKLAVDGFVELRQGSRVILRSDYDTTDSGTYTDMEKWGLASTSNAINRTTIGEQYLIEVDGLGITDYIGDVRVDTLLPTTDVQADFYPRVGPLNSDDVGETLLDLSATITESGRLKDLDRFTYTDITNIGLDFIYGIQNGMVSQVNSVNTITAQQQLYLDANTFKSTNFAVGTEWEFTYEGFNHENNLWTAGRWTEADINSLQGGYSIEAIS